MTDVMVAPLELTEFMKGEVLRYKDISGVSGTGLVAQIVLFSNGKVVVAWLGEYPTTETLDSLDHFFAVHGHNGATVVHWEDQTVQRGPATEPAMASP